MVDKLEAAAQRIDAKLAELFPEWEWDQRECIANELAIAAAIPTEDARSRVKVLEKARPFSEWHEDRGDVLWWKLPLAGAPYCGSPLDLGRGMKVTVQIGFEEHEMPIAHTGGWPFSEADEPDLWWTPLPSPTFFRTALGNKETDR